MDEAHIVKQLLSFLAYVGGFAAIPFVAKRFSGILGTLTGMVNDRSKGIIDRPRNWLSNYSKERRAGKKAARRRELRQDAASVDPAQTINPLTKKGRREIVRTRKRIRVGWQDSTARRKAGGRGPRPSDFLASREDRGKPKPTLTSSSSPIVRAYGRRQKKLEARDRLIGAGAAAETAKASKEALDNAKMGIAKMSFKDQKKAVLNDQEDYYIRSAALINLAESDFGEFVHDIIGEARVAQKKHGKSHPLVRIVADRKYDDTLWKSFKNSNPDLATAVDETTGEIKDQYEYKRMHRAKPENVVQWSEAQFDRLLSLPSTHEEEIGGVVKDGSTIVDEIVRNQGVRILESITLSNRLSPKNLRRLRQEVANRGIKPRRPR